MLFPGYDRRLRAGSEGPVIENAEGGTVDPGTGFYVRATQAALDTSAALVLTGAFQAIPLVSSAPLVLSFANPQPNLRYYGEIAVPIENGGATAYSAQFSVAFRRTDAGGTPGSWEDQTAPQRYDYDQAQASIVSNQLVYRSIPVLGSAIVGDPVQNGDTLLEIRFQALGTNSATIPGGTANRWAWFFETL